MPSQPFSIERFDRQPVLSMRTRTTMDAATSFFDRGFPALFAHAAAAGARIVGAPLSIMHEQTEDALDIEIALPLDRAVQADGEIVARDLPAVEAATTYHVGSYADLAKSYEALHEFVRASGREADGAGWEFYVDDPRDVPVERRRTRIALPLKD